MKLNLGDHFELTINMSITNTKYPNGLRFNKEQLISYLENEIDMYFKNYKDEEIKIKIN